MPHPRVWAVPVSSPATLLGLFQARAQLLPLCASRHLGDRLAWFVSLMGAFVHICCPQPWSCSGRRGQARDGSDPTVLHPSLLCRVSPAEGPHRVQVLQTWDHLQDKLCGDLQSWVCLEEGTGGLGLPSPTAGTPFSAAEAPWVWQCRRDRNWSCKSSLSGGAPVATAALQEQEGVQELVYNGEVRRFPVTR